MKFFEKGQLIYSNKGADMSKESFFTSERKTEIIEVLQCISSAKMRQKTHFVKGSFQLLHQSFYY
jgi:hypothetical protein